MILDVFCTTSHCKFDPELYGWPDRLCFASTKFVLRSLLLCTCTGFAQFAVDWCIPFSVPHVSYPPLLQACRSRVSLTVRHPITLPSQLDYPQSSDHDPFQSRPPPEYPYPPPAVPAPVHLLDRDPPPYSSASSASSAILAGPHPLQSTAGVYSSSGPHHHQAMYVGERRPPSPPPPPPPAQEGRDKYVH